MLPCKSIAEKVSFEWSRDRISLTDVQVRITLPIYKIVSGNERIN